MGVEELVESHMGELRMVSLKVFGMVPYAGAFLSLFVSIMWPEEQKDPWGDVKKQVQELVSTEIDKERAKRLQDELDALSNNVKNYRDTTGASQKSQMFTTILADLERMHVFFIKEVERAPWNISTMYIIYGTLALGIWREQCLFYKAIYGIDDPDAALHLRTLTARKNDLINGLDKLMTGSIDHRKELITWEGRGDHETMIDKGTEKYEWNYNKMYKQDVADAAIAQRKAWVENSWANNLTDVLSVSKTWQFMDMIQNRPSYFPTSQVVRKTGPYGSSKPKQVKFDDEDFWKQHGDITKIIIHEADKVDGIEVFYGGVSSGLRGKAGGEEVVMDLDINKGERCVEVSGLASIGGGTVDNIQFFRRAPLSPKPNVDLSWIQKHKHADDTTDEDINNRLAQIPEGSAFNRITDDQQTFAFGTMSTGFLNRTNGGDYANSPFAFKDSAPPDQNPHWYDGGFYLGDNLGGLRDENGKTVPVQSVLADEKNPTEWVAKTIKDERGYILTEWKLKKNRPTRRLAYIFGEYSPNWTLEQIGFAWAFEEIKRP